MCIRDSSKDALLLVVADGMGGHRHGEIAAQLAVTTMTDAFQRLAVPTLSSPAKFLIEHIQQVHDMIDQLTQEREMLESPRTTIAVSYTHLSSSTSMRCANKTNSCAMRSWSIFFRLSCSLLSSLI